MNELPSTALGLDSASPTRHHAGRKDGEEFYPNMGISWYDGESRSDIETVYADLWLPQHALSLVDNLRLHRGITLVGTVGAGKSTLVYGTRALLRADGTPYMNINGHYKNTKAEDVVKAIDVAEEKGMTIIYDSADYLVGGHRRVRTLPLSQHIPRNLAIMKRLIKFRENDGSILLSSHHPDWVADRAHPELLPAWEELVGHTVQEDIDITLPVANDRSRLLQKMGLHPDISDYIAQLPDNPGFLNHIINEWGDTDYMDWAQQELSSYQMLKLLARDNYKENEPVLEAVRNSLDGEAQEQDSWDKMLEFVYSKTYLLVFFTK